MDVTESANVSVLCFEKDIKKSKQDLSAADWGYVAFDLFLAIGISFGNGLIVFIMARVKKLRTISNYLKMQLAIADLALGLILVCQLPVIIDKSLVADALVCALRYAILFLPVYASLIGLLAVTIDRYLAIMDPFRCQRIQMRRYFATTLGVIIPMAWYNRCPVECDVIMVFRQSYLEYIFIPLLIAITLPLTILCVHILIKAKQQLQNIMDSEIVLPGKENPKYIKGQFKILKAGLPVICTFYVAWLPFVLILIIQVYSGTLHDTTMDIWRSFSMGLIAMNSITNPLIYGYRLPDLKAELRKLFRMSSNDVVPFQKADIATTSR